MEALSNGNLGVLIPLSKSLKNTIERFHFGNVSDHMTVVLPKKGTLSQAFFKILPID